MMKLLLAVFAVSTFFEQVTFDVGGWTLRLAHIPCLFLVLYVFVRVAIARDYSIPRHTLNTSIGAFVLVCLVSLMFSDTFLTSLKASLLLTLFVVTSFSIFILFANEAGLFSWFEGLFLKTGFVAALYVIFSMIAHAMFGVEWVGAETTHIEAFSSGLGTGEVVRAYGAFSMATSAAAILVALGLTTWVRTRDSVPTVPRLAILFTYLLGAFFTYSRGFVLGLLSGLFIVAYHSSPKLRRRIVFGAAMFGAIAMALGSALVQGDLFYNLTTKFAALSDWQSGSGLYRLQNWILMVGDFLRHPILGRGLLYYKEVYPQAPNAESFVIELLSGVGILGLLLFLRIVVFALKKSFEGRFLLTRAQRIQFSYSLCFVMLFFGFLTNPGYWTFLPWVVFGMLLYVSREGTESHDKQKPQTQRILPA
jgi:hypothetical protein